LNLNVVGIPHVRREQLLSDNYLKFVVTELKPFIDATYRTLHDQKNTFIMGSSMGGLISPMP
jgi:predicted alpha/beta superfamily hydrolase